MKHTARPLNLASLELGEAPFWNPFREELSVVDIERGLHLVFEQSASGWSLKRQSEPGPRLGAAVPLNDGSYLLCRSDGIWRENEEGSRHLLAPLPIDSAAHRINDAKLGRDGKLWFGVMHVDAVAGAGSLWRLGPSGVLEQLLTGLTIPNGMDWFDDEFWFVDGPKNQVRCFVYKDSDELIQKSAFATSHTPDGLVIDHEGNLLVALWGAGKIVKYSRLGVPLMEINVAAPNTTSLTFLGPRYEDVIITSARLHLGELELSEFPDSGDIFLAESVGKGREPNYLFG